MFEHAQRLERAVRLRHVRPRSLQERERHVRPPGRRRGAEAVRRRSCSDEAREIDRVGRYGGEEFMLLLPGTVLDAAVTFAERVRKQVEAHTFTFDGGTRFVARRASASSAWPHPRITALRRAGARGRRRAVRGEGDRAATVSSASTATSSTSTLRRKMDETANPSRS